MPACAVSLDNKISGKNLAAKVVDKELEGHWLDITVSIEMKEV